MLTGWHELDEKGQMLMTDGDDDYGGDDYEYDYDDDDGGGDDYEDDYEGWGHLMEDIAC